MTKELKKESLALRTHKAKASVMPIIEKAILLKEEWETEVAEIATSFEVNAQSLGTFIEDECGLHIKDINE